MLREDASGVKDNTNNVTVFFTGATLTREALSQEVLTEESYQLIPTPIPSPGQDGTGSIPGKVCGTRRRTRDVPVELTLPPRRRHSTVPYITSHYVTSHHITSRHITLRHVTSHHLYFNKLPTAYINSLSFCISCACLLCYAAHLC